MVLRAIAAVIGALLVVAGCALLAWWVGLVVAGSMLLAAGLLSDDGRAK